MIAIARVLLYEDTIRLFTPCLGPDAGYYSTLVTNANAIVTDG